MIVPTLRVGMHPVTLRVTPCEGTRSVPGGIPLLRVGTISRSLRQRLRGFCVSGIKKGPHPAKETAPENLKSVNAQ
ncbi:hypothetical protein QF019_004154 [Pseudomonas frederiksbergensis]